MSCGVECNDPLFLTFSCFEPSLYPFHLEEMIFHLYNNVGVLILTNDCLLHFIYIILFFSLLARRWMKNILSCLSSSAYRHVYLFQSSFFLLLICYGWTPQPTPKLWDIHYTPLKLTIHGKIVVVTFSQLGFYVRLK